MNSQYARRDRNGGTGSPSLRYRYPLLTGKIEMHLICSLTSPTQIETFSLQTIRRYADY